MRPPGVYGWCLWPDGWWFVKMPAGSAGLVQCRHQRLDDAVADQPVERGLVEAQYPSQHFARVLARQRRRVQRRLGDAFERRRSTLTRKRLGQHWMGHRPEE